MAAMPVGIGHSRSYYGTEKNGSTESGCAKAQGFNRGGDIEKTFDLSDAMLAVASDEYRPGGIGQGGIGSTAIGSGSDSFLMRDYVDLLNDKSGSEFSMTLFLADGISMAERDVHKRIYGTITFAYLEYECAEGKSCSIERVPEIE